MRKCWLTAAVLIAGAVDAFGGPVTGTVRVTAREGVQPATTIVYAEPLDGASPKKPGTFRLTQKGKTFVPRVLAVDADAAMAAAKRHLFPDRMLTVVVGDRERVGAALETLGLGEPVELSAA